MSSPAERLSEMLGFDPSKKNPSSGVFAEAMKEYNEERNKELKSLVKEKLAKAVELHKTLVTKRNELEGLMKKVEKELGKVLGQLEAMSKGAEPPKEEDNKENVETSSN